MGFGDDDGDVSMGSMTCADPCGQGGSMRPGTGSHPALEGHLAVCYSAVPVEGLSLTVPYLFVCHEVIE